MAHELLSDIASLEERIHSCRDEQLTLYKRLLELSDAQRGAIARGDTDALLWATEEKGRLIERIDAIDIRPVSYTTSPSPRDRTRSRMPSSA